MKKITAQLFVLYCCSLQTTWGSPSEVKTLIPTDNHFYLTAAPMLYKSKSSHFNSRVKAGGFGGNERIGKLIYSGNSDALPALEVARNPENGHCYLINDNTIIFDDKSVRSFDCVSPDPEHDNLYWSGYLGAVNGGNSPENDTLYAADVTTNMFKDWYDIPPVIDKYGLKTQIMFVLHSGSDNAYIKADQIHLGDGYRQFYPLTSLSVIGYMVGQMFTDQQSQLDFWGAQSGGIHIAFSSMTAMAVEFYATNKNTWQIASDVSKTGDALHYMDKPSKNCHGKNPGDHCDIDTLAQFYSKIEPHYSSGLFNRAFYLLATTNGWDTHKAYDIFMQANRYHWKKYTDFQKGSCDVVTSAKELGYDTKSVMIAFSAVGIDTRDC